MKFTTKTVVILFIVLVCLGIFLYQLNQLTKKQAKEEQENENKKRTEVTKKVEERIQRKLKKNALLESFMAVPFTEADSAYGDETVKSEQIEATTKEDPGCPDILIHRGDVIVLYNSKQPGKPVAIFKTLDEYAAYVHKQQLAGVNCPVLYLRREVDLQGRDTYRMYPFYIPHQTALYDQYSLLTPPTTPPAGIAVEQGSAIRALPSVHYPVRDGDLWSNGGFERPAVPMPPPFLKSLTAWEVHHMPPLYVEGGLPVAPIEKRTSIEVANVPEIPTPMTDSVAGKPAMADFLRKQASNMDGIQHFDAYALNADPYIPSDKMTKPPKGTQLSDNAADPNWGGVLYTVANVEAGKYDNNMVKPALYPDMGYV
jgi:hypothetical protein